ncbi:AraC family transcriptional regulator [Chitinophaga silvatica]|uniref:AraC family transcriptional regulator n=1 Tax=Chitinophaga silvatica TaxID=2282649 RepID=A0A3E1Y9S7_9BACT|nr:helix-turn-helix domain-containing protein [Chitinophaga silvatica]RFS22450.1 AraC family transcriptional regulator [Chitinophaga silvatica]
MSNHKSTSIALRTIEDFNEAVLLYSRTTFLPQAPLKGSFAVHERSEHPAVDEVVASRRDYYKITLLSSAKGTITLGDETLSMSGPTLIFLNPHEIKSWEFEGPEPVGYYCLFTDLLFRSHPEYQDNLLNHPLLQVGARGVFSLTVEQCGYLESIFRQLIREYRENTAFKLEAIVIYLKLLMLEGKRLVAQRHDYSRTLSAGQVLANKFTDKLEKQFPIDSPKRQIKLKTVKEFAAELNTHPNHLNASVKQTTGRTVSEHIRQRILLEARLLLMHTDWQIAEIAWCLGFEDPGNFTHFFKNHGGVAPHIYRGTTVL